MKNFKIFAVCILFSFVLSAQEKPEGLFINSKAPDFKANDQYGKEIRLKEILKDTDPIFL